jgi:copper amine oxidase-like protein
MGVRGEQRNGALANETGRDVDSKAEQLNCVRCIIIKRNTNKYLILRRRNLTMKKFISFVMAGAMVASLVPATAFAKGEVSATAKVVDSLDLTKEEAKAHSKITEANYSGEVPEVQLKISDVDYRTTGDVSLDVEFTLDNAEFISTTDAALLSLLSIKDDASPTTIHGADHLTGGSAAAEEHYTDTVADSDGPILVKDSKVGDDKVYMDDIKVIPDDFEVIPAKNVEEQLADLIAAGYIVTTEPVFDGSVYTAGVVAKAGSIIDLTDLVDEPEKSIDDQEAAWATENGDGYTRCDGTHVAAVSGSDGEATFHFSDDKEIIATVKESDDDAVTFTFKGKFGEDDVIVLKLESDLTKTGEGTKATVSIDSKAVSIDDLVYATVLGSGIKASIKKTVDIAEDEKQTLYSNGLKIETAVGDFVKNQEFELKLSNGFEFSKVKDAAEYTFGTIDDNEVTVKYIGAGDDEFTIDGDDIEIEATSAKSGSVATLTVKALKDSDVSGTFSDTVKVEVAKVVDYKVNLTVDEDEDLPVIYSATNVDNKGLTDDSDHWSLEVTAEETFPGAWSMRKGFNFNLPDGVYVTDVDVTDTDNFVQGKEDDSVDAQDWQDAFFTAYQDGDHKNFEFKKRVFNDVNTQLEEDPATVTFKLQLVADPTFEGDVVLKFEGDLVDEQEVTIAKFVKPYTVKAEQNDVIIDYRNTEVKTPIVITEAEAGLWEKDVDDLFKLNIEDNLLEFENDATFTVDSDSDMKLKDEDTDKGTLVFTVDDESDDKPATVTISDMKLFMQRNIPAGAYDLEISTVMSDAYDRQVLYAPDADTLTNKGNADKWDLGDDRPKTGDVKKDSYVDDVCDYSDVVKEAFINVVTAGVDKNNMFTTKVVVPVGEAYLVAGEAKVELDAPAYISAAGYTMLPVRAISKALGVDTNNVLWNAETRTVTIMYAQRIISMTVGQKTIYVNGSSIPTSAAPEITNGRTYLPLRDLGTALGVTNVSWDAATKTATLN